MYISESFSSSKDIMKYVDGVDVFGSAFLYNLSNGCPTINMLKSHSEDRIDVVALKSGISDIGIATHMFANIILSKEDIKKRTSIRLVPYSSITSIVKASVNMV